LKKTLSREVENDAFKKSSRWRLRHSKQVENDVLKGSWRHLKSYLLLTTLKCMLRG
jgi:hypothetical protein